MAFFHLVSALAMASTLGQRGAGLDNPPRVPSASASAGARPPGAAGPMQVSIEPADIAGELAAYDRDALVAAVHRGLTSSSYTIIEPERSCGSRKCREDAVRSRAGAHRVELHLRAGSRTYELELQAYRPDEAVAFASTTGRCEVCGIAELEQLVLSKADALRQRLESHELAPAMLSVSSSPNGASVRVDGGRVGVTPFEGEVSPGAHRLEIAHAGYFAQQPSITAARGVHERLHVSLDRTPRRPAREVIGAVSLALGVAALAGGITMLALDGHEIGRRCDASQLDDDGDCRWVHQTKAGGTVLTVAGTALATTGATLLIVEHRWRRVRAQASLSPRRVALTLSF